MFLMSEPLIDICNRLLGNANKYRALNNRANRVYPYQGATEVQEGTVIYVAVAALRYLVLGGKGPGMITVNIISQIKNCQKLIASIAQQEKFVTQRIRDQRPNDNKKKEYMKIKTEIHKVLLEIQKDLGECRRAIGT